MAGRKPVPGGRKSQKGRARIQFEALNPHEGTPPPPAHLDTDGVWCWVQACRSLSPARLVSHADLILLEMMAEAFSAYRKAIRKCKRDGKGNGEYQGPDHARQVSAARTNANKQGQIVKDLASEMGIGVASRLRTTDSAQGDLPFDEPVAPETADDPGEDAEGADNIAQLFKPRRRN